MPSTDAATPRDRFARLVDEFVREQCALNPALATFLGFTDRDHEVIDTSAAGFRHRDDRDRHWLQVFEQIGERELSDDQRVDRQLLIARLGAAVRTADFESWRRSPEHYVADGVFELFVHQMRPEAEAVAAAIDRLAAVPRIVADAKANLDASMAHSDIIRRDLVSVRGQAVFLRDELGSFVSDPALRDRLVKAAAPAAQAYDELGDHLEQLAQRATGTFVFGEQRYNAVLQQGEMLTYGARELRELGRREYDALDAQMQAVAQRISGSPDWKALLPSLQKRCAADLPGMLQDYRDATDRARTFVIDHDLMTVPPTERCAVEPAPAFMRGSTAVASYFPAAPFMPGSRGTFNVPYTPDGASPSEVADRLQSNALYEIPATTAHEAYPGHHLHFVHMANANAVRQFMQSTYFVEGWALYTEKMMAEQGFYRDDSELLGQLAGRIMRAARVVVDTSLHLGEMSVDEAAEFMRDKVGLPPSVAKAEALRYAAWPTQASAYLTGAIEIERARDRWLAAGRGTLRQFHDAICDQGALPPGLAARAIGVGAPEPPQRSIAG